MQRTCILLALGGGSEMIVPKNDITVPELMVLAAANGIDAITEVGPRTEAPIKHAEEYARLARVYSPEDVSKVFGPNAYGVTMPTRFSDIKFGGEPDEPEPEPEPVRIPTDPATGKPEAPELKLTGNGTIGPVAGNPAK